MCHHWKESFWQLIDLLFSGYRCIRPLAAQTTLSGESTVSALSRPRALGASPANDLHGRYVVTKATRFRSTKTDSLLSID